ncbi:hypothetical protein BRARA_I01298 [Brassica rapa]|uniref:Endoglucanase n=1 Tax=Brassica campestris TaxID=3711 RepID=A0A397XTD2_BRACM|nr:hypothetical protein BRARA_I01298 [Brassica rapa]
MEKFASVAALLLLLSFPVAFSGHDYGQALSKSLLFFEAQRSGVLPRNQRVTWRSHSGLTDGKSSGRVHHRGSSIVSYKVDRSFVTCRGGYATWFSRKGSDPNLLTGAIVGGPDAYDNFADRRDNYEQTEPATYNNAPLLGVLARLSSGHSGYSQLLPAVPAPVVVRRPMPIRKPRVTSPVRASGPVAIVQKMTGSWVSKGRTYYRYSTTVINKSPRALKSLNLSIKNLYGPIWGLSRSGNSFGLPSWMHSLQSGKSLEFVYIHSTTPANVAVSSYTLA